jgi:glyoxylase-like metal-dependent hydrolase (beta-lactamase superfamily II)
MKLNGITKLYALGALAFFTMAFAAAQQDLSKVEIKATAVAGNVHMLEGAGGNIGVSAGPDGVLIVDDQFAPLAEKIRASLKSINPGALRFVLNTHWHGDHTGGNAFFSKEATIIAHDNVRARLMKASERNGRVTPAAPKEAWPVITYGQSVSIHFNGEEIRVTHLPKGHTDGDSLIYFTNSKVAHLGDEFFAGRFPFIDLNSGGSVSGLIKNIGQVVALLPPDVKIIPGHGPLSTHEQLKAYHQTIKDTTEIVRARMKAGQTLDQIKAAGLPEKYADWGSGFIKTPAWIETIYKSLEADAKQPAMFVKPPTE